MANILDIRRRIRSVVNTRQITKAMKTVSAAKLRRAQEGALAARPYSQMLTNVLHLAASAIEILVQAAGFHLRSADRGDHEARVLAFVQVFGFAHDTSPSFPRFPRTRTP